MESSDRIPPMESSDRVPPILSSAAAPVQNIAAHPQEVEAQPLPIKGRNLTIISRDKNETVQFITKLLAYLPNILLKKEETPSVGPQPQKRRFSYHKASKEESDYLSGRFLLSSLPLTQSSVRKPHRVQLDLQGRFKTELERIRRARLGG